MAAVIAVLSFVGSVIGRIFVALFLMGFAQAICSSVLNGVIKACAWIKAKLSKTKDAEKPKESEPPTGWEAV
jgi:hypothetical protein